MEVIAGKINLLLKEKKKKTPNILLGANIFNTTSQF